VATILRDWSYRYQWLYDGISRLAALSVGGENRFRHLALQGLSINADTKILDLCCGSGQTTQFLVGLSGDVTGLDASPFSVKRARQNVPEAKFVEAFAEEMPFSDDVFDLVHSSVAMHEMEKEQRRQIFTEVFRVLKPGGVFTMVDFHSPSNVIFWPGLAMFLWLFETHTSWELLDIDLLELLKEVGFVEGEKKLFAGGSLQVIKMVK